MIVDLPSTTTKEVSKRLVSLRNQVGAMAMGRVLTLIVVVDEAGADDAVATATEASRQHPARIVVLVRGNRRGKDRLDAQIRVGGDAGASEVIVLRMYGELTEHSASVVTPLLLPDSPVVAWWPQEPPADVAGSPVGTIAHRRITDAGACAKPATQLRRRARHYRPGDTDLVWTRITRWRALLAAALDQPPHEPVTGLVVEAEPDWPNADLLAGWLAHALGLAVQRRDAPAGARLVSVGLERPSGTVELVRSDPDSPVATLRQPGRPDRTVALAVPSMAECLAEELRRLDADEVYAAALLEGLPRLARARARTGSSGRSTTRTRTLKGPGTLAPAVARALGERIEAAVAERGVAHVVLTGGSMGTATVQELVRRGLPRPVARAVHLWWGDERFVAADDGDRNAVQAHDAGLADLGVPEDNVHVAPAGTDPAAVAEAAETYAGELARYAAPGGLTPLFDVVLLGLGPDGHIASLFPGRPEVGAWERPTVPVVDSPKPPPLRISLTVPALRSARVVWFVVAGADKHEAVTRTRTAADDHRAPGSLIQGVEETVWWLDRAAADGG